MAFDVGAVVGRLELDTSPALKQASLAGQMMNRQLTPSLAKVGYQAGALSGNLARVVTVATQMGPASGVMATGLGRVATMALEAGPAVAALGAAALGVAAAFAAAVAAGREWFSLLNRGIGAIDTMNTRAAMMAANITNAFPDAPFEEALEAARQMIPMIERMDVKFSGSGEQLLKLADSLTQFGAAASVMKLVTDATGRTQQAFIALGETLKSKTGGQGFDIQVMQEIRNLMTDQREAGGALVRHFKAMGANLEVVKRALAEGDIEKLMPFMKGAVAASKEFSETLSAQRATWQTITDRILRSAFLPAYRDVVSLQQQLNRLLFDQKGDLTDIGRTIVNVLQGGWLAVKNLALGVWEVVKGLSPGTKNWADLVLAVEKSFLHILNVIIEIGTKLGMVLTLKNRLNAVVAEAAKTPGGALARLGAYGKGVKELGKDLLTVTDRYKAAEKALAKLGSTAKAAAPKLDWNYRARGLPSEAGKGKKGPEPPTTLERAQAYEERLLRAIGRGEKATAEWYAYAMHAIQKFQHSRVKGEDEYSAKLEQELQRRAEDESHALEERQAAIDAITKQTPEEMFRERAGAMGAVSESIMETYQESWEEIDKESLRRAKEAAEEQKRLDADWLAFRLQAGQIDLRSYIADLNTKLTATAENSRERLDIEQELLSTTEELRRRTLALFDEELQAVRDSIRLEDAWGNERTRQMQAGVAALEVLRAKYGEIPEALKEIEAEIAELTRVLEREAFTWSNLFRNAAQDWHSSFSDYFFDFMRGEIRSLSDLFADVLAAIQRQLADWLASQVVQSFLGFLGNAFGMAGLGGLQPSAAGGGAWAASRAAMPGLASGGIVTRPTLAMIGEAGPEAVVPLDRGGGVPGQPVNVNVTIYAMDSQDVAQALTRDGGKAVAAALGLAGGGNHPISRRR